MKVDDILILTGKTKHGKNRVREQGALWKVIKITTGLPHSAFPPGAPVAHLETLDGKHWRWVSIPEDANFDFHPSSKKH